ncbi:uncharacterized protein [Ptychodera flava]|uniref:uncharacterized protein n=1 Tax=Ptychodera flava TaxID=63121 RepID=UPI00396A4D5D
MAEGGEDIPLQDFDDANLNDDDADITETSFIEDDNAPAEANPSQAGSRDSPILPRNSGVLAVQEVVYSCCDSEEDTEQNSTNLSDDQQRAVDLARCGHNVFITGPAGSGKSYVVKRIYQNLTSTTEKSVQIVCPTGAACSIYDDLPRKSETVHSYFGVGLADQPITAIVNSTKEYISKKLNQVDVIILDEVSMLSARLFNLITLIAQRCRDNDKPFGGIQVVAVGDFYQLPPVPGFVDPGEYAFISPFWKFTFKHHVLLTTIYRQHSQTHLLNALNSVRIGQYDAATIDFLNTLKRPLTNQDSATHIYFNNLDVDYHNMCCLDRLPGQCSVFHSIDQGELREIERRCLAPKTLIIKEGAPVMLLYNLSKELHNGCIGTYNCVDVSGNPVVTFHDKYIHCAIPQRTWTYKDDQGREIARRCQYPLNYVGLLPHINHKGRLYKMLSFMLALNLFVVSFMSLFQGESLQKQYS